MAVGSQTTIAARQKQNARQQQNEFVNTLLGLFRPKMVWPGYETMPIPPEVQQSILVERMLAAKTGEQLAAPTEALWYISTVSLIHPLSYEWVNIMTYLCRRWLESRRKPLPDFLKDTVVLNEYEERLLYDLRRWIYKKGMDVLKNGGRDAMQCGNAK